MIMRLVAPEAGRQATTLRIHRWYKAEGDRIAPGDDLFMALVEEGQILDVHRSAQFLTRLERRLRRGTTTQTRALPVETPVRVVASEPGILARVLVAEGEEMAVGDLVALVATDPEDAVVLPDQAADAPRFRVVSESW